MGWDFPRGFRYNPLFVHTGSYVIVTINYAVIGAHTQSTFMEEHSQLQLAIVPSLWWYYGY